MEISDENNLGYKSFPYRLIDAEYQDKINLGALKYYVDGDWKHDHMLLDNVVKENFNPVLSQKENVIDTGDDCYPATHVYYFYFEDGFNLNEAAGLLDDEDTPVESDVPSDSLVSDALDESNTAVAIFHRKPESVKAIKAAEANGITTNKSNYKVVGTKELSSQEFEQFANHLSQPTEWLKEFSDINDESGMFTCVEVKNKEDETSYSILVDPQGYDYARYAAINEPTLDQPEEELVEPEIDETLDATEE